jgi:hypothetical protein
MINFAMMLNAVKLAGSATPAFKAIFDHVLPMFTGAEQDALKTAYQAARLASDDAENDFVQAGRGK